MKYSSLLSIAIVSSCLHLFATPANGADLIRLACFEVSEQGNPKSRMPGFVAIAEQVDSSSVDASLFVPGTLKYEEAFFIDQIPFRLKVYKNAPKLSDEKDFKLQVEELLTKKPHIDLPVIGGKALESMTVYWEEDGKSSEMAFHNNSQEHNTYINNSKGSDRRFIFCETPYTVPENKPTAVDTQDSVTGVSYEAEDLEDEVVEGVDTDL